ncbi:hypothetical protein D3C84_912450 [compost metagenome]
MQQQRGHLAERLRQDDQAHALCVAHAERRGGAHLAPGDGLDAGADDLAEVGRLEHHEGHQAGGEGAHRGVLAGDPAQDEGHREVEPGDHQQQRDRAEVVDVGGGEVGQQLVRRQPQQRQQGAQHYAAEHAEHHQLEGHPQAVGQPRQRRDDCGKVHHLPPTAISPGTATFFSTVRISIISVMFRVK